MPRDPDDYDSMDDNLDLDILDEDPELLEDEEGILTGGDYADDADPDELTIRNIGEAGDEDEEDDDQ